MQRAVLGEEHVRARRLGHVAAIIVHQRVLAAGRLGGVLGERADHVEASRLRLAGDRPGVGPAPLGDLQADAPRAKRTVEVARPRPDRDGAVDRVLLRRNAHHLRAAPGDRAEIGVGEPGAGERLLLGGGDLVLAKRDLKPHRLSGREQAVGMGLTREDLAPVGALPFEHGARIMQRVGQDVDLRVAPGHEHAVHPDLAVQLIEGNCHRRPPVAAVSPPPFYARRRLATASFHSSSTSSRANETLLRNTIVFRHVRACRASRSMTFCEIRQHG